MIIIIIIEKSILLTTTNYITYNASTLFTILIIIYTNKSYLLHTTQLHVDTRLITNSLYLRYSTFYTALLKKKKRER